jgi:predicted MFS family arabinose efflux permease
VLLCLPRARSLFAAGFVENGLLFGAFAFFGAFLHDQFALAYSIVGPVLGAFAVGGFAFSRSAKWLVPRMGERRLMFGGGLLIVLALVAMAVSPWWQITVPMLVLIGGGYYMMHTTLQTRATAVSPEYRGMAVGVFAFFLFAGQGIGAAALGWLVDARGYGFTFMLAGLAFLGLTLWLTLAQPSSVD